jgi:hypothetical protein
MWLLRQSLYRLEASEIAVMESSCHVRNLSCFTRKGCGALTDNPSSCQNVGETNFDHLTPASSQMIATRWMNPMEASRRTIQSLCQIPEI